MTQDEEVVETLRKALSAWDKYEPDASNSKIIAQANDMAEAIRAALSQPSVRGSGELGSGSDPSPSVGEDVPSEGWVLVPREPTPVMLRAGEAAGRARWGDTVGRAKGARRCWGAMISGASTPAKHRYWRPGEPDCPREIKGGNGELHTLRCKVCGLDDPRDEWCLSAAPSPPASSGWRGMDSAPRDGTPFLAVVRVYRNDVFFGHDMHIVYCDDETGEIHSDADQGWNLDDYEAWQPLPSPPADRSLDDGSIPPSEAQRRTAPPPEDRSIDGSMPSLKVSGEVKG